MSLRIQSGFDPISTEATRIQTEPSFARPEAAKVEGAQKELEKKVEQKAKDVVSEREVETAVESINNSIEYVNRGLKFSVHEDTSRLMVQVVNLATQEVLKDIPPEDVLDTVAKIREMIGVLLDERA